MNLLGTVDYDKLEITWPIDAPETIICLRPFARCYVSGKSLFGRRCIRQHCYVKDAPKGVFILYYFDERQFTLWTMKNPGVIVK